MAKRYFISRVIGTGTNNDDYRAEVSDAGNLNAASLIPSVSQFDGTPKYRFALSIISTPNLPAALIISNSYCFPDYPLDARMDGMNADARQSIEQTVAAYDWDGNGYHVSTAFITDSMAYRDVITGIAQQIEPAFQINNFDVAEVSQ